MRRYLLACLFGLSPAVSLMAESADPIASMWTSDEPTAAEIENLCLLNRFRADPRAEADRIVIAGGAGRGIDWATFRSETASLNPVPPAVWNNELTKAARQHIRHLLATRGRGHSEKPGKPYFVAASHIERMKKAGYTGKPTGENWAAWDDPSSTHSAWIIDAKGKDVGHRRAMIAAGNQEVGIAMGAQGLQKFGTPRGNMIIGIAVFADRNGDGRYNEGEGVPDVPVWFGDVKGQTGAAGYARLEVPSGSQGLVYAGKQKRIVSAAVPAGQRTMHWDVIIDSKEGQKVTRALASMDKIKAEDAARRRKAAVALAAMTDGLFLDQAVKDRLQPQVQAERDAIHGLRQAVVQSLATDPAAAIAAADGVSEFFAATAYAKVPEMVRQMALAQTALQAAPAESRDKILGDARKVYRAVGASCPDARIALYAQAEGLLLR